MKISRLSLLVIVLFCACKKSDNNPTTNRTFNKSLLVTSFYTYDTTGVLITRDSFAYDQNGYLATLYHYFNETYLYPGSPASIDSISYTFSINPGDSLITSCAILANNINYSNGSGQFTFQYDGQNRLVKILPPNSTLSQAQFAYFSNGITFDFSPNAVPPDSLYLNGGNVTRWVSNEFPLNFNYFYTNKANPFYSPYMAKFGVFFWAWNFPEQGSIFDVLSQNLPDSSNYATPGLNPTTSGSGKYSWSFDGMGRVKNGTFTTTSIAMTQTGVIDTVTYVNNLVFNYAQ